MREGRKGVDDEGGGGGRICARDVFVASLASKPLVPLTPLLSLFFFFLALGHRDVGMPGKLLVRSLRELHALFVNTNRLARVLNTPQIEEAPVVQS